jgi:hypothetical protein
MRILRRVITFVVALLFVVIVLGVPADPAH